VASRVRRPGAPRNGRAGQDESCTRSAATHSRYQAVNPLSSAKPLRRLATFLATFLARAVPRSQKAQVRGSAPSGTRTPNPLIKSQLLCQLS
jgi:hypothetical protein